MLKSIHSALKYRQQSVGRQSSMIVIAQEVVTEFLQKNYPETPVRISVQYQEADKTLVLITQHKTLAGELSLRIRELQSYFTSRNVRVEQIVVR